MKNAEKPAAKQFKIAGGSDGQADSLVEIDGQSFPWRVAQSPVFKYDDGVLWIPLAVAKSVK